MQWKLIIMMKIDYYDEKNDGGDNSGIIDIDDDDL